MRPAPVGADLADAADVHGRTLGGVPWISAGCGRPFEGSAERRLKEDTHVRP